MFKNLDNVPCTLYGYPGVAQAAGTPVTDIGQPSTENPTTAHPGHAAARRLRQRDAADHRRGELLGVDCKPVKATWLAVIPPNQTDAAVRPVQLDRLQGHARQAPVGDNGPAGNGGGPA